MAEPTTAIAGGRWAHLTWRAFDGSFARCKARVTSSMSPWPRAAAGGGGGGGGGGGDGRGAAESEVLWLRWLGADTTEPGDKAKLVGVAG